MFRARLPIGGCAGDRLKIGDRWYVTQDTWGLFVGPLDPVLSGVQGIAGDRAEPDLVADDVDKHRAGSPEMFGADASGAWFEAGGTHVNESIAVVDRQIGKASPSEPGLDETEHPFMGGRRRSCSPMFASCSA